MIYKVVNSHGISFFYNRFEGRIFECCHYTLSISTFLPGLMGGIWRFIFFICTYENPFFTAFICSSDLLQPDSTICWLLSYQYDKILNYYSDIYRWAQGKVFAVGTTHVKLLHFYVLHKVLCVKCFSLFISKHVAIPELFTPRT